jgi:hypothetical protein
MSSGVLDQDTVHCVMFPVVLAQVCSLIEIRLSRYSPGSKKHPSRVRLEVRGGRCQGGHSSEDVRAVYCVSVKKAS